MSQQINLINPLLLKKRHAFGLREMTLGLGLVLAAALAWFGYLTYRAARSKSRPRSRRPDSRRRRRNWTGWALPRRGR